MAEREDIYQKILDKEGELVGLRVRMDTDQGLLERKPFQLKDVHGNPKDRVANITLNDPVTYSNRVRSTMNAASMQRSVEGKDVSKAQAGRIEEFDELVYNLIDERLCLRDIDRIDTLYSYATEHIAHRGRVAARCLVALDGNKVKFDLLPIDARYLCYQTGINGLIWVAYRGQRTRDEIQEQYRIDIKDKTADICVYLDKTHEHIFIDGEAKGDPRKHGLGYPPVVVARSWIGSNLRGTDNFKFTAESIFSANRELYALKNEMASILRTINLLALDGYQFESKEGDQKQPPDARALDLERIWMADIGGGWKLIPIRDIGNYTRMLYQLIDSCLQRGSLPNIEWGNLTFPLSYVAMLELGKGKDQLYVPMLQGLSQFYQGLSKMIRSQILKGGVKGEQLGGEWQSCDIPKSDLEREYTLKYTFFAQHPEKVAANYTLAQQAEPFVDDETLLDIIGIDDPNKVMMNRLSEEADQLVPLLRLYKMAKAKEERGEEREAKFIYAMLFERFGLTQEQLEKGELLSNVPRRRQRVQAGGAGNLLPAGGKKARAKEAFDEGTEAKVEEAEL